MTQQLAARTYAPTHRKSVKPSRPRPHTIEAAYARLTPEMFVGGQTAFNWALAKARRADRGHERDYTRGMNLYEPFTKGYLDIMAYENVHMWLDAYRKQSPSA